MTISSLSSSYFDYSSLMNTGTYNSTSSVSSDQEGVQGAGGPPPPPPGGGQGGGQGMEALDLDTDSDGLWSAEEIDAFAAESGSEVDSESILATYDTDGDGYISSSEEESMQEDNAFNLPSPQDMMDQMRGFGPPPNIQSAEASDESSTSSYDYSSIEDVQASLYETLLEAYSTTEDDYSTGTLFDSSVS